MSEKQDSRRIQVEVRHALMTYWDPIGINDEPACADEYDSYISGVIELLTKGGTDGDLGLYFRQIARDRMELIPDEPAILRTIKALREISPL